MRRLSFAPSFLILALAAFGQTPPEAPPPLVITTTPLGDTADGVVTRIEFTIRIEAEEVPPEVPLVLQGSILQEGKVVRNFRYALKPDEMGGTRVIQTLPVGSVEVEARVMVPLEESAPVILAKHSQKFEIAATGKAYVASEDDGPEAFVAEGVVPEIAGSVKLRPPRRSLAPNLFIVDVDTRDPVRRVEFYVEGKKIFTRNGPPYRAELDLGMLPRRVEVRVVGYDAAGRYIDADAWIVNERETPLEVKLTRTITKDDISHFKVSIQNSHSVKLASVALFIGDKLLQEWKSPPYALDIATRSLAGAEFVRVTALTVDGIEASDLLFLDGSRYMEQIEVNLVELPASVVDSAGTPVTDLKKEDFTVLEGGKPQKIAEFAFADNLPLSVGVIVDHSGSMKERIADARTAAIEFFEQIITEKDRAFFGAFSWDTKAIAPFVSNIPALKAQVGSMPEAEGATALYDAIVSGLYRFRTVQGRKALILVTDGADTASRIPYEEMLKYVRASRVPIYFVGIGISSLDFSATGKMKSLAAETGGVAYFIGDMAQLKSTYEKLERELRMQYLLSYYTESSKGDERYRTVEIKTARKDLRVRTIRGFIP